MSDSSEPVDENIVIPREDNLQPTETDTVQNNVNITANEEALYYPQMPEPMHLPPEVTIAQDTQYENLNKNDLIKIIRELKNELDIKDKQNDMLNDAKTNLLLRIAELEIMEKDYKNLMNKEIHNESDQEKFNHLSKLKEIIVVKDKHIQRLEKQISEIGIGELDASTQRKAYEEQVERLEGDNSKLQAENKKLNERLVSQNEYLQILSKENTEANLVISNLQSENMYQRGMTQEAALKNYQLEGLANQINQLQIANQDYINILNEFDSHLLESGAGIKLEINLEPVDDEGRDYEISNLKANILQLEEKRQEDNISMETLREEIAINTELRETDRLQYNKNLNEQRDELNLELETIKFMIDEKDILISEAQSKNTKYEAKILKLQSTAEQLTTEQKELKYQNELHVEKEKIRMVQIEEIKRDLDLLNKQYKDQQQLLQKRNTKINKLLKDISASDQQLNISESKINQLENSVHVLIKQLEEKKRQLLLAHNKNKQSDQILEEMNKELGVRVTELDVLKEMIRSAKIQINTKEKEIGMLRKKVNRLQKESLESSNTSIQKSPQEESHEITYNIGDIKEVNEEEEYDNTLNRNKSSIGLQGAVAGTGAPPTKNKTPRGAANEGRARPHPPRSKKATPLRGGAKGRSTPILRRGGMEGDNSYGTSSPNATAPLLDDSIRGIIKALPPKEDENFFFRFKYTRKIDEYYANLNEPNRPPGIEYDDHELKLPEIKPPSSASLTVNNILCMNLE